MGKAFEFKGVMKEMMEMSDQDYLLKKLKNKLEDMPELEGVIKKITNLNVDETTKIQIQIVEQDFRNCENITYEKIIQRNR